MTRESMLSFLWHFRGSVRLDSATSGEAALDRAAAMLVRHGKTTSTREASQIAFHGSIFDMTSSGWDALFLYDRGRVWIERNRGWDTLRYDLRSLHAFIFCAGGSVMFFVFGTASAGLSDGVKAGAFAFTWLYGMNLLIAAMRVPGLFRSSVRNLEALS